MVLLICKSLRGSLGLVDNFRGMFGSEKVRWLRDIFLGFWFGKCAPGTSRFLWSFLDENFDLRGRSLSFWIFELAKRNFSPFNLVF